MSSIYHFTGNLLSFNTAVCVDCIAESLGLEVFDRAYNSFFIKSSVHSREWMQSCAIFQHFISIPASTALKCSE